MMIATSAAGPAILGHLSSPRADFLEIRCPAGATVPPRRERRQYFRLAAAASIPTWHGVEDPARMA
jgi:hypothetical protein